MKIIIRIEKRNALIILGVSLVLIAILAVSGDYINPVTNVGHDLSELGSGELAINLNVTGDLIIKDIQMENLAIDSPVNNLINILCEGNGTYCPQLFNAKHGTSDCLHLGGNLTLDPDNSSITFCKVSGGCSAGWTQYKSWSTTSDNHCDSSNNLCHDCSTGRHAWSNKPREKCGWESGTFCENRDCYAGISEMGCY